MPTENEAEMIKYAILKTINSLGLFENDPIGAMVFIYIIIETLIDDKIEEGNQKW